MRGSECNQREGGREGERGGGGGMEGEEGRGMGDVLGEGTVGCS